MWNKPTLNNQTKCECSFFQKTAPTLPQRQPKLSVKDNKPAIAEKVGAQKESLSALIKKNSAQKTSSKQPSFDNPLELYKLPEKRPTVSDSNQSDFSSPQNKAKNHTNSSSDSSIKHLLNNQSNKNNNQAPFSLENSSGSNTGKFPPANKSARQHLPQKAASKLQRPENKSKQKKLVESNKPTATNSSGTNRDSRSPFRSRDMYYPTNSPTNKNQPSFSTKIEKPTPIKMTSPSKASPDSHEYFNGAPLPIKSILLAQPVKPIINLPTDSRKTHKVVEFTYTSRPYQHEQKPVINISQNSPNVGLARQQSMKNFGSSPIVDKKTLTIKRSESERQMHSRRPPEALQQSSGNITRQNSGTLTKQTSMNVLGGYPTQTCKLQFSTNNIGIESQISKINSSPKETAITSNPFSSNLILDLSPPPSRAAVLNTAASTKNVLQSLPIKKSIMTPSTKNVPTSKNLLSAPNLLGRNGTVAKSIINYGAIGDNNQFSQIMSNPYMNVVPDLQLSTSQFNDFKPKSALSNRNDQSMDSDANSMFSEVIQAVNFSNNNP